MALLLDRDARARSNGPECGTGCVVAGAFHARRGTQRSNACTWCTPVQHESHPNRPRWLFADPLQ